MTDRQSTHSHNCWSWGPGHYKCAVAKIERLRGLLGAARCPNCDGSGVIPYGPTSNGDWEVEPCQWCYEKQEALAGEGGF